MTEQQIIELIERNPSIGRNTSAADVKLMDAYYHELTGKNIEKKGCGTCIKIALNHIRAKHNYPPIGKVMNVKLSAKRIETCKSCDYSKGSGILLTCGTPVIGGKVDEGELCGCFIHAKAKFRNENCPLGFWDK